MLTCSQLATMLYIRECWKPPDEAVAPWPAVSEQIAIASRFTPQYLRLLTRGLRRGLLQIRNSHCAATANAASAGLKPGPETESASGDC
jgi:hypothetical protein